MAELLQITGGDGQAELVHLDAVVVDVELLEHIVAGMAHQVGRRGTQSGPAAVAHVHGAGRIGGNVLDVDLAHALGHGAAAVIALLGADLGHDVLQRIVVQVEVDEAGACDLDLVHQRILGNGVDDDLSDFARILLSELRAAHSGRARPIAVAFVSGSLERDFGSVFHLKFAGSDGRVQRSSDKLRQFLARLHRFLPFRSS